ncbi:hypothetical protein R3P38DRAFT_2888891 [Favolaschia claudopus]|uniref:Taste receptor type 2 n=1 Tax=Favolaschia claudopus TaxID=2862362 RepID=A0AAW0CPV5_9AGAR
MPKLISGNTASGPIVSVSLQGIIYGVSVCMFGMSVWVLAFQRRDRNLNAPMLFVACVMWILCTMRMFIDIAITAEAFTKHASTPNGPEIFLSDFSGPVSLLDNSIYGIQTLIGDAVVIYRCYVVWGRFDVVVVPCMAWIASLGMVIYLLTSFAHKTISETKIVVLYSTTLAANLSATSLLAFRIWQGDRNARKNNSSQSSLRPLLIVIIESGVLYTTMLIMALVTVLHFLAMEYVVNSVMPAIISITFSMIFIRVGLARNHEDNIRSVRSFPLSALQFRNVTDSENTDSTVQTTIATK